MSATPGKLSQKQIKTLSQEVAPTPIRALRQLQKVRNRNESTTHWSEVRLSIGGKQLKVEMSETVSAYQLSEHDCFIWIATLHGRFETDKK